MNLCSQPLSKVTSTLPSTALAIKKGNGCRVRYYWPNVVQVVRDQRILQKALLNNIPNIVSMRIIQIKRWCVRFLCYRLLSRNGWMDGWMD